MLGYAASGYRRQAPEGAEEAPVATPGETPDQAPGGGHHFGRYRIFAEAPTAPPPSVPSGVFPAHASQVQRTADAPPPITPAPGGVVRRLIHVPFAEADQDLTGFAGRDATGLASGPYVLGVGVSRKIGVDEGLLLIGHGNGTDFYSHADPSHKSLQKYTASSLATYLHESVLPRGYAGTITVWACSSATPWRHMPAIAQQVEESEMGGEQKEAVLDTSFIKQLEASLEGMDGDYQPTVVGSLGYATLDRRWDRAQVYADEQLKMLGKSKTQHEGFIDTRQEAPTEFYEDSEDEEEGDGDWKGGSDREGSDDERRPSGQSSPAGRDEGARSGSSDEERMDEENGGQEGKDEEGMDTGGSVAPSTRLRFQDITLADESGKAVNAPATFRGWTVVEVLGGPEGAWQRVGFVWSDNMTLVSQRQSGLWMKTKWLGRGQPV